MPIFGMELKKSINAVNDGECDYEKDFMKIRFNSDDDLPLNKPVKFHRMTIIIRSVFEEDGKLYLNVFLDGTLLELSIWHFSLLVYEQRWCQ